MADHECVDCKALPEDERPLRPRKTRGGPRSQRCLDHRRRKAAHDKVRNHARYVGNTYGLPDGFYDALYAAQDGKCAGCRRATGASKKLAVDHDHKLPEGIESVRGLLCSQDNWILRVVRDDPEHLRRLARYLEEHPAQAVYLSWTPTP